MKQLKIHFSFIFLLFLSCSQKKETLQQKLESEFEQSKLKIAGKEFNIRTFPDWEAKAYFKNNKAVLIFEKTKPEIGFTTKRIYCDEFGNVIEKVVYRKCLPNWREDSYKLHDSTFIVYPKNNLVEGYFENKLIDSSVKVKFSEEIIRQAKYTKKQVEDITAVNSRLAQ
jgi:hypothetical protein